MVISLLVIAETRFDPARALDAKRAIAGIEGLATDKGDNYVVRLLSTTSQRAV
jgi:hypothetical protein